MATVYSNTNDGVITTGNMPSWSAARDATSGTHDTDNTNDAPLIFVTSGRGGTTYKVGRVFMYFDTSGITGTLSEATLKLYWQANTESYIVMKSDAFGGDGGTALADADFNNVTFGTGTLIACPSSFPSNSGITTPTFLAAPVEVGIIERVAALALRKSG